MTKMSYLRKRFKSESNLTHKTANFPNFASQERPAVKQKEATSMRRCGREIVRGEDEFLLTYWLACLIVQYMESKVDSIKELNEACDFLMTAERRAQLAVIENIKAHNALYVAQAAWTVAKQKYLKK